MNSYVLVENLMRMLTDNIYDIECLPYIDAYNKYHIPIIKILRAYSRVDYSKRGFQFSDATIDQLNSNYLSSWGFIQKYGRWYYYRITYAGR